MASLSVGVAPAVTSGAMEGGREDPDEEAALTKCPITGQEAHSLKVNQTCAPCPNKRMEKEERYLGLATQHPLVSTKDGPESTKQ